MLEIFALIILCLSVTAIFYLFIFIHDLPHHLAKKRNHPQVDAIHCACWLSLFTLHAIWPLVFLWSVSNRGPLAVKIENDDNDRDSETGNLEVRLSQLESQLQSLIKETK